MQNGRGGARLYFGAQRMDDKKELIVCLLGRMGDIIAAEPLFRRLKELHPDRRMTWIATDAFADLLRHAPFLDKTCVVRNALEYLELKKTFPRDAIIHELNLRKKQCPSDAKKRASAKSGPEGDETSLLEKFACELGVDVDPEETPRFHFSPESETAFKALSLPPGYAVFHCVANGRARQWRAERFRRIARFLIERGVPVVEVGFDPIVNLNDPGYFPLTNCRDLQTLAQVVRHARLFFGVESGFGHMANAVGTFMFIVTGALNGFPRYDFYSGRAKKGRDCNLVRFYGGSTDRVPCEWVEHAMDRFLAGRPMSGTECELDCLRRQILASRDSLAGRIGEALAGPWRNAASKIRHHRLRARSPRALSSRKIDANGTDEENASRN